MTECGRNPAGSKMKIMNMSRFFKRKGALILVLLLVSICLLAKPLQQTTRHSIIIDTDGAIDDFRAICMLLSRPEISIRGIILSDGSLAPADGAGKVRALLHAFHADTIPVGPGSVTSHAEVPWRAFNQSVTWGGPSITGTGFLKAEDILHRVLAVKESRTILVCLGPLTNVAEALRNEPNLKAGIEKIIWYNEAVDPPKGFNYSCDTSAASIVLHSGIRIDVISNLARPGVSFDRELYNRCKPAKTTLASLFCEVHSEKPVAEKLNQNHFRMADELAAIYLVSPELFDVTPLLYNVHIRYNKDYNVTAVREVMQDMIDGNYAPAENVVFNAFPEKRELFAYDVRQIMDSAICRYGHEEWKANVMTDEFHGHLGVYSIVGAKMGIKARELFGVGPDMLEAVSFAGLKPPYSCLNDGIQASTGATLGMGTIRVDTVSVTRPEAIFTYKGRSFRISLKPEYLKQVDADITEGIVKFGLMDDGYWKLIRRNALRYWLEWDRNKIFDIVEVKKK